MAETEVTESTPNIECKVGELKTSYLPIMSGEVFRVGEILDLMPKLRADIGAIAKGETANTGTFKFNYRSIETVMRALAPLLGTHGITTSTDIIGDGHAISRFERKTKAGVATTVHSRVTIRMYWIAPDGSFVTSIGAGEGMDGVADFASDKATSYAIKQCIIYGLIIPATGMPDPHGSDSAAGPDREPVVLAKRFLADANTAKEVSDLGNRFSANKKGIFSDDEKALLVMMAETKLDKINA